VCNFKPFLLLHKENETNNKKGSILRRKLGQAEIELVVCL
jgi:hypothetical protein